MSIIKANNIDIYYEVHGQGEPLILIAGLSKDSPAWFLQLEAFSQHFQVIVFDNRGVGRTEAPDSPYSTQMMADDVIALMEVLNIPTANILGHSMGGCIAQNIAIQHPQKVKRLILLDTFAEVFGITRYVLELAVELQEKNLPLDLRMKIQLPWSFSDHFLGKPENITFVLNAVLNNPYPQKPYALLHQINACKKHNTKNALTKISVPTLIMEGAEDRLTPAPCAQELIARIPQTQHIVIPQAGHNGPIENPTFFNEKVLRFLLES